MLLVLSGTHQRQRAIIVLHTPLPRQVAFKEAASVQELGFGEEILAHASRSQPLTALFLPTTELTVLKPKKPASARANTFGAHTSADASMTARGSHITMSASNQLAKGFALASSTLYGTR